MTKFGITALLGAIIALIVASLDDRAGDFITYAFVLLAAVLIGAFIAVESKHQHMITREKTTHIKKEHDEEQPGE